MTSEDTDVVKTKDEQKFEALESSLDKGGAYVSKLKLKFYSKNFRGVHAAEDIKKESQMMYVP